MRKNIHENIRFIRENVNLSQDRFGKKIGLSGKTISAYENGKITPTLKVLEKISSTYNVNLMGVSTDNFTRLEEEIKKVQKGLQDIWEIIGIE